jgi:hypothetical protein
LDSGAGNEAARATYLDTLRRLNGDAKTQEILNGRYLLIFPSLAVMDFNLRVIQPITYDHTEIYSYPMLIDGIPDDVSASRLLDVQVRIGTAGIVGTDDLDIFNGIQTATGSTQTSWLTLSRGMDQEKLGTSGERVGAVSDEVPQRAFWRRWRSLMAAHRTEKAIAG